MENLFDNPFNIETSFWGDSAVTPRDIAEDIASGVESSIDHYIHKGWSNENLAAVASEEYFEAADAANVPRAISEDVFADVFPTLWLYL